MSPDAAVSPPDALPAADWVIAVDPAASAGPLDPGLLGQYELSGARSCSSISKASSREVSWRSICLP